MHMKHAQGQRVRKPSMNYRWPMQTTISQKISACPLAPVLCLFTNNCSAYGFTNGI